MNLGEIILIALDWLAGWWGFALVPAEDADVLADVRVPFWPAEEGGKP